MKKNLCMSIELECAGWIDNSCDDGPGMRSVLFLQGCNKNCPGCHNQRIKEHGKGTFLSIENLLYKIEKKCRNKKITISGGEPLEQIDGLLVLLEELKYRRYNICLYTGWELEKIPQNMLELVNYIKTGAFIEGLRNENMQYAGSKNQHLFQIINNNLKEINLMI